jgi:hypothetical protein
VHAAGVSNAQVFRIRVERTSFAEEDPSLEFVDASLAASVEIDRNTSAPRLFVVNLGAPLAGQLRVSLQAIQDDSGPMSCTIGIELVGRPR